MTYRSRLGRAFELPVHESRYKFIMTNNIEEGLKKLYKSLPFKTAFQAQALLYGWHLLPVELISSPMLDAIRSLDPSICAQRLTALRSLIEYRSPLNPRSPNIDEIANMLLDGWTALNNNDDSDFTGEIQIRSRLATSAREAFLEAGRSERNGDGVLIHSVTITPAGILLRGPFADAGNRVICKYPGHDDNYLRVSFTDEGASMVQTTYYDRTVDFSGYVINSRFRNVLTNGIVIAGCRFEPLAFSSSQLRTHGWWFVRSPFILNGTKMITADSIRSSIGDLAHIRCAPRYAARLGLAFSTTLYSITIKREDLTVLEDVCTRDGRYQFSDGVGTISQELVSMLNRAAGLPRGCGTKTRASNVFQTRLDGAKGVLALDPTLSGRKVCLRRSMVKFRSPNTEWPLAVASHCTKPLPCFLNRPIIALLESLGVPAEAFLDLQAAAVGHVRRATQDSEAAARLLDELHLGKSMRLSTTLSTLRKTFAIDAFASISFMKDLLRTAVIHALRQMKYRARIRLPFSHTLMGVMDESGHLNENEIYACVVDMKGRRSFISGKCLVYRSPALCPGDVQYAQAIGEVPMTSPLYQLTNCVVFSQKGKRPLPSKLSGGDLDGDLYSVVQEERVFPKNTYEPASYETVKPVDQPDAVTVRDIVDFFLEYIVNNNVGRLSINHLCWSDLDPDGVFSDKCLQLAEIHKVAIDYPKTGLRWTGVEPRFLLQSPNTWRPRTA